MTAVIRPAEARLKASSMMRSSMIASLTDGPTSDCTPYMSCCSSRSESSCTSCLRRTPPPPRPLRRCEAAPGHESPAVQGGGSDHRVGLVQRLDLEMRVGPDGEERTGSCRANEKFSMGHAVALIDLDRDPPLDAESDQPLLPFLGVDA